MSSLTVTGKTRLKRIPQRGAHDRETIDRILDEGLICHVGFVHEGTPCVVPTIHWRQGDRLYLHGSVGARMFKDAAGDGIDLCVTVTLLDGLVLARSAFHHSLNYRSVMVFGRGRLVEDAAEKREAFDALVDHVIPGRSAETRPANDREMKQTAVLSIPLDEASAKIRAEGVHDDKEDMEGPHWAGVVPLRIVAGAPVAEPDLKPGIPTPGNALHYTRPGWDKAVFGETAASGKRAS